MTTSDDIWGEAIQEAYASAPVDEIVLHTLELRHPAFVDDQGDLKAIRMVSDYGDFLEAGEPDIYGYNLGLESDAPFEANQTVTFVALMFDLELPAQQEGSLPTIEIKIDGVSRDVTKYLDDALEYTAPIEITYREYLLSDKTEPQFVLNGMTIQTIKATNFSVTATASFADLVNRNFPAKLYRPGEFRGLI